MLIFGTENLSEKEYNESLQNCWGMTESSLGIRVLENMSKLKGNIGAHCLHLSDELTDRYSKYPNGLNN